VATNDLDDLRRMRAAKNQSLFRQVNERVEDIAQSFDLDMQHLDFICECAHTDCVERLELSVGEYEAVRSAPTHFAVAGGHEIADVETVVERTSRYVVVAKLGVGGELANKLDPRQAEHA
jgi:hypothetical protein